MIIDSISNTASFAHLPWFDSIQEFLSTTDVATLEPGTVHIDGDKLYAIIADDVARDVQPALEAHRLYIDLQLTIRGSFDVLWRPLSSCTELSRPYDEENDYLLMGDSAATRLHLSEGVAAVFFPEDAHAPQPPNVSVRKVVFKIHV